MITIIGTTTTMIPIMLITEKDSQKGWAICMENGILSSWCSMSTQTHWRRVRHVKRQTEYLSAVWFNFMAIPLSALQGQYKCVCVCVTITIKSTVYNCHNQTTTIFWPLYRTTCISQHPQLRTGGFCWSKILLPVCPCWRQLVHSD